MSSRPTPSDLIEALLELKLRSGAYASDLAAYDKAKLVIIHGLAEWYDIYQDERARRRPLEPQALFLR